MTASDLPGRSHSKICLFMVFMVPSANHVEFFRHNKFNDIHVPWLLFVVIVCAFIFFLVVFLCAVFVCLRGSYF